MALRLRDHVARGSKSSPADAVRPRGRGVSGAEIPRRNRRGRALATTLGAVALASLAAGVLYASTRVRWLFDDGFDLGLFFGADEPHLRVWMHVLYLPLGRWLGAALGIEEPYDALSWLSVVAGAVGVGAVVALLRAAGCGARTTWTVGAVVATTPLVWFYATLIEVHVVHCACVAVALWGALALRWRHAVFDHVALAALGSLLFLSHQTGVLLVPAFACVALAGRVRRGGAVTLRSALSIGGACVLGTLAAIAIERWLRSAGDPASQADFISRFDGARASWIWWRREVFASLGTLVLAWIATVRVAHRRLECVAAMAAVAIATGFFGWWGIETYGGYFAGVVPFLALAVGVGVERLGLRTPVSVAAAIVACAFNAALLHEHRASAFRLLDEAAVLDRAERAATLPPGTLLFSFDPACQPVDLFVATVDEHNLFKLAHSGLRNGVAPGALGAALAEVALADARAHGGAVALDRQFLDLAASSPGLRELSEAFLDRFTEEFASGDPPATRGGFVLYPPLAPNTRAPEPAGGT